MRMARMHLRVGISLLAFFLWSGMAVVQGATAESEHLFRMGFSRKMFPDVNEQDAKAAIKGWADTLVQEYSIRMDPSAELFDQVGQMIEAIHLNQVDCLSVIFGEYLALAKKVELDHLFIARSAGQLFEQYLLLVPTDGGAKSLAELKGGTLIFHDTLRTSLALDWLDWLFLRQKTATIARHHFGSMTRTSKVSGAVLPLFFGKADATLVTESGFLMMCEMNPQVRKKMRVLAKSRPLIPAVMCFRKEFNSPEARPVIAALRDLDSTLAGEQVLTLFRSEGLQEMGREALQITAEFYREVEALRQVHCLDASSVEPD